MRARLRLRAQSLSSFKVETLNVTTGLSARVKQSYLDLNIFAGRFSL